MSAPCIARLPPELCADVLAIAACDAAEVDKPWLALLATASQLALHIVKPILYHTILLTDANFERIVASSHTGNFLLTRRLWVSTAYAALKPAPIAETFIGVEHFSGWHDLYFRLRAHNAAFCPRALTLRSNLYYDDWHKVRSGMRHITHLHLAIEPYYILPGDMGVLDGGMVLKYVVLEATTQGWNPARLVNGILPFFFSSPTLERLLVCATTQRAYMRSTNAALEEYATKHRERRLWVMDEPTDGKLLPTFRPGVTFDPDKWTVGRQLCASMW